MNLSQPNTAVAVIIGHNAIKVWQQTPSDRWQRIFKKTLGYHYVFQVATPHELPQVLGNLPVVPSKIFVVHGSYIVDEVTVRNLSAKPDTVLVNRKTEGRVIAGLFEKISVNNITALWGDSPENLIFSAKKLGISVCEAGDLASNYHDRLRKRYKPYVFDITATNPKVIERVMFNGSYKGVTDIVTKYIWPPIALPLTRLSAFLRLSPNMVTSLSFILMLLAMWLFYQGCFAFGLLAGWVMTLLDTVDGKLARVTLTSSKFGDAFDHGIDLIHPPFWWWAWWYGVIQIAPREFTWFNPDYLLLVIISGYIVQRLIEGCFALLYKMHIHVWRRIDTLFRLITARRNPNLVILTVAVILGFPGWGLVMVGMWIVISCFFHLVRLCQALQYKRKNGNLVSWLSQ